MQTETRQNPGAQNLGLNVKRLSKLLLFSAVLPLGVGVALDVATGLLPYITIVVGIVIIPLASFLLTRTILAEFDEILTQIAPEEQFLDTETSD